MSQSQITVGVVLEDCDIPGLSAAEIAEYGAVSGDNNPVHSDLSLAKRAGLEGIPAQGMFLMAVVASNLEKWPHCRSIRKLAIRFVSPVLAERQLRLSSRIMKVDQQRQTVILRILLYQRQQIVSMGEADIVLTGH